MDIKKPSPPCRTCSPSQECFDNSSLFHKALKEAFESFCNKQVAGTSVAELMAAFCDNLLKKVGGCLCPEWCVVMDE